MNDQDTIDAALFAARPPRSTNCTTCQGRGHVERPYVLRHTPMLAGVPTSAITATVVGAASIFEATREASEIATRAKRNVAFYFMDKIVIARPNGDPDALARCWWQGFYGKSYEESVNDR